MSRAAQPHRHNCPDLDLAHAHELLQRISGEPWLSQALDVVAASDLPHAWVGAGVIRDVIWGQLNGGFDPTTVNDVDVAFFDANDLSRQRDHAAQQQLQALADLPWEATNQAAVHTWYHDYFREAPVIALSSVHDAVATWPETATCVALRITTGGIDVCAPHGLGDLLNCVWRRNPTRVSIGISRTRLIRQKPRQRWPSVTVIPPS